MNTRHATKSGNMIVAMSILITTMTAENLTAISTKKMVRAMGVSTKLK
jgi:hypothetical protein